MLLAGIVVVALATLFSLTVLALAASGRLPQPTRVVLSLAGALVLGAALLFLE